ncbi:MAG: GDP-mannose 4,6-dehydratase [Candidatus Curtissbacteria bacterium]|nr:GDP-mannose 4,6-dehydratase [Candidatus Curtissbacteria bacterium]
MAKNSLFKKNVLITGGLGFIGSNLAIKLVESGAKVTILDALLPDYGGNKFNIFPIRHKVKVKIADMRNQVIMDRIVRKQHVIFNLAGTLSHIDSMLNPFVDLDINCRAQLCLLEACRKYNPRVRIIFAGTRNQYGRALYLPVDEKHIEDPTDINGINSTAGEKYHFLYHRIYGLEVVSLRMTNTFGLRHQMKHPKQGVLNWFIRLLMDNKTVELFGDGSQIRDINYIDDVVDALILAAQSKRANGNVYNLGGIPITLLDFVKITISHLGYGKFKMIKFPKERKSIEIGNYVADIGKIKNDLGWSPKVSPDEGIERTLEYYKKYRKHYF